MLKNLIFGHSIIDFFINEDDEKRKKKKEK